MNDKDFDSNLSVEVQLAWEVMTCKAMRETYDEQTHPCRYFNQYFGPWFAYGWIHEKTKRTVKPEEIRKIDARTNGSRFTVPALTGGCRRAPIMTIGINPNNLVGPYAWLKFTLQNHVMMSVDNSNLKTCIIISPHFSYPINFTSCYAFSLDEWKAFQQKWPDAAKLLNAKPDDGQVLIALDNIHANKEDMKDAWDDLKKMPIEPYDMIASIIVEEFKRGTLKFYSQDRHFERTDGPCRLCNNHLFTITKRCPYGKDSIPDTIASQKRIHKNAVNMSI
jgi:hypothetical protein